MLSLSQSLGARLAQPAGQAALDSLLVLSPALLRSLSTHREAEDDDAPSSDRSYVDRLKLTARAGKGGNGCVSMFQSNSRGRHASADGGNGGDGGSIVIRAVPDMKSLAGVQQLYTAEAGLHGTRQRQHGRAGRDTVVLVPVGTVVQRMPPRPGDPAFIDSSDSGGGSGGGGTTATASPQQAQQQGGDEMPHWVARWRRPFSGADYSSGGEESDADSVVAGEPDLPAWWGAEEGAGGSQQRQQEQEHWLLADLTEAGQEVVVARGGAGGRGNAGIKARAHRPAPADAERGAMGEVSRLLLELKLLADVGLVGLPNAGKSTLLRALTAATPRVGDYAFTTLKPQLGVVPAPNPADDPVVIADIPGLIRGAHENRGLGHHFLRHIERTQAIAYVLDCTTGNRGVPGPKTWEQLALLHEELAAYSPRLARLPALVVANKAETLAAPERTLAALQKRTELPIVAISARERCTWVPLVDGAPQPGRCGSARGARLARLAGLHPLHFQLEALLHGAGARQYAPSWPDFEPAWLAAQQRRAGE